MDYYQILGVSQGASAEQIKRAYRQMAQKYHPDRSGGDAQKFKEVNEAYQVLSDTQKRAQFDQYGSTFEDMQRQGQAGGFRDFRDFATFSEAFSEFGDLGDLFGDIFGGASFTRAGTRRRGADINLELAIDLEEAIFGSEKQISLDKYTACASCGGTGVDATSGYQTCPQCQGSGQFQNQRQSFFGVFNVKTMCSHCQGQGRVPEKLCSACQGQGRIKKNAKIKFKIPAGINQSQIIKLSGQGEAGNNGSLAGDLNIKILLRAHKYFVRRGDDLYYEAKVRFTQLAMGDKIKIPTPQGEVWVNIPKAAQVNAQIRLRGQGVPHLNSRGRGDEIVKLSLEVPKKLSRKQKKILEELKQEEI